MTNSDFLVLLIQLSEPPQHHNWLEYDWGSLTIPQLLEAQDYIATVCGIDDGGIMTKPMLDRGGELISKELHDRSMYNRGHSSYEYH